MRREFIFALVMAFLSGTLAGCKSGSKLDELEMGRDYDAVRAIDMEKANSIPMQDRIMLQQRNDQQRTNDRMNTVR